MNKAQAMEQLRRAIQMFAATLSEENAVEIATLYDAWQIGRAYQPGEFLVYGQNSVGDPQLYKVVQGHTSQQDWTPHRTASLYTPLGLNEAGYPTWSQPTGAHDAYNLGDVVDFNGVLYESLINGNVYSPDTYPNGWTSVTHTTS